MIFEVDKSKRIIDQGPGVNTCTGTKLQSRSQTCDGFKRNSPGHFAFVQHNLIAVYNFQGDVIAATAALGLALGVVSIAVLALALRLRERNILECEQVR